jgi:hypothetical protein
MISSSMATGKETICSDGDCIAGAGDEKRFLEGVPESEDNKKKRVQKSPRSSMAFNSKKGCDDDECIGAQ